MKKHGFTLAEILITLGIIGVVAALTAPALVQNAGNAKIGPTLAKVKATIENAHEQMMQEESVSSLYSLANADTSLHDWDDSKKMEEYNKSMNNAMLKYCAYLSKYIVGSSYEPEPMKKGHCVPDVKEYGGYVVGSGEGLVLFHYSNDIDIMFNSNTKQATISKGSFKGPFSTILVDINGVKTAPNTYGKDIFFFTIDNSGTVLPEGSRAQNWAYGNPTWESTDTSYTCNATKVDKSGFGCTGSIFDNNLKVIYK